MAACCDQRMSSFKVLKIQCIDVPTRLWNLRHFLFVTGVTGFIQFAEIY